MNSTICPGTSITYTAAATGTTPLSYQWYKQIFPVSNAIYSIFSIQNVSLSNANQYYCTVRTLCGKAQSGVAYLSVINFSITSQPSTTSLMQAALLFSALSQMIIMPHTSGSKTALKLMIILITAVLIHLN